MEKEKTQISLTLAENESVIRTWCENCDDIQIRPMKLGKTGGTGALLIYVEVAVSCVMLKDSVIGKLLNRLMDIQLLQFDSSVFQRENYQDSYHQYKNQNSKR